MMKSTIPFTVSKCSYKQGVPLAFMLIPSTSVVTSFVTLCSLGTAMTKYKRRLTSKTSALKPAGMSIGILPLDIARSCTTNARATHDKQVPLLKRIIWL
jgi:hypothetical protein